MNREIKFRYYCKETKTMTYQNDMELQHFFHAYSFVEECNILMQYIGLKDKNGKEIYDGDIVRIKHPNAHEGGDFHNDLGRVFWYDEEAGFYHGHCFPSGNQRPPKKMFEYCEVIGNIYENPELLEDNK